MEFGGSLSPETRASDPLCWLSSSVWRKPAAVALAQASPTPSLALRGGLQWCVGFGEACARANGVGRDWCLCLAPARRVGPQRRGLATEASESGGDGDTADEGVANAKQAAVAARLARNDVERKVKELVARGAPSAEVDAAKAELDAAIAAQGLAIAELEVAQMKANVALMEAEVARTAEEVARKSLLVEKFQAAGDKEREDRAREDLAWSREDKAGSEKRLAGSEKRLEEAEKRLEEAEKRLEEAMLGKVAADVQARRDEMMAGTLDSWLRALVASVSALCSRTIYVNSQANRADQCRELGLPEWSLSHALPFVTADPNITANRNFKGSMHVSPPKYFGLFLERVVPIASRAPRGDEPESEAEKKAEDVGQFIEGQLTAPGQQRKVAVIAQASGSGKTKSAYDLALHEKRSTSLYTVVATIKGAGTDYLGPWSEAVAAVKRAEKNMRSEAAASGLRPAVDSETPMLVAMGCYLEWVYHVIAKLQEDAACKSVSLSERELKLAVFAATYNGSGSLALDALAKLRLRSYDDGALDRGSAANYVHAWHAKLWSLLPTGQCGKSPGIVLALDEAPALMESLKDVTHKKTHRPDPPSPTGVVDAATGDSESSPPRRSLRTNTSVEGASGQVGDEDTTLAKQRNGLHALTEAVRTVIDKDGLEVCLVGTYYSMVDLFADKYSALRGRATYFHDPCMFTADDMWTLLGHYFADLPAKPPAKIHSLLQRYEGRPYHFCEPALFALSKTRKGSVLDRIEHALESAWATVVTIFKGRLSNVVGHDIETRLGARSYETARDDRSLFSDLYFALLFKDGVFKSKDEVMRRGVKEGILVWQPSQESVDLKREPALVAALEQLGAEKLAAGGGVIDRSILAADNLTDAEAKGVLLERAVAWGLLRQAILQDRPTAAVPALPLGLSLCAGFELPKRLHGMVAKVTRAEAASAAEPFRNLFDASGAPRTSVVVHRFPNAAGVDLAYWVVPETPDSRKKPALVLMQCKAGAASLGDAVRSVTPAWQFVEANQRAALSRKSAGVKVDADLAAKDANALARSSLARDAFWALATSPQFCDAFATAVRVVMPAGGAVPEAVAIANEVNETRCLQGQEIVLAESGDDWMGAALASTFREHGVKLRATGVARELLPQSVQAVQATWEGEGGTGAISEDLALPDVS